MPPTVLIKTSPAEGTGARTISSSTSAILRTSKARSCAANKTHSASSGATTMRGRTVGEASVKAARKLTAPATDDGAVATKSKDQSRRFFAV